MMKLLVLVVSVQTLLIALLYLKVGAVEQQVDRAIQPTVAQPAARAGETAPSQLAAPAPRATGIDSAELRRVIREELRATRLDWTGARQEADSVARSDYDEADMQRRQEKVMGDLNYLRAQDEVSQAELDLLLADIARLDPQRRSEALRELNRAMNRGEIRGNL